MTRYVSWLDLRIAALHIFFLIIDAYFLKVSVILDVNYFSVNFLEPTLRVGSIL